MIEEHVVVAIGIQLEPPHAIREEQGDIERGLPKRKLGAGDGAQCARVAQQVSPLDDAERTENRQGRKGPASWRFVCTG
jgi:hypothetical protein